MILGYARVSTKTQAKDGNSLEAQEEALRQAGATEIYKDAFTWSYKRKRRIRSFEFPQSNKISGFERLKDKS